MGSFSILIQFNVAFVSQIVLTFRIGYGKCLEQNRWQAVTWTNDASAYWCIYPGPNVDELNEIHRAEAFDHTLDSMPTQQHDHDNHHGYIGYYSCVGSENM